MKKSIYHYSLKILNSWLHLFELETRGWKCLWKKKKENQFPQIIPSGFSPTKESLQLNCSSPILIKRISNLICS